MEVDIKALALSGGLVFGLYVFMLGIIAMSGWGTELVGALGALYLGYEPSVIGALIGFVWAFADGAIAGALIAFVYNTAACKKTR